MAAIKTSGLTKRFGDVVAVHDLDMTVEDGEVFGFLGPNGAGKSTTINVLLGFLEPTAGSATVLGEDVESDSLAVRDRIGVLPEEFSPYERLSAREHVEYAAGLKDCRPNTAALLDRVGLQEDAWDRPAGEYSKGMCQRLALATALVGDPELLILDEPSSGLDPEGMAGMRDLIREEAESGTTVFFSSHLLSEVEAVCDRVAILAENELAVEGTLDELRAGTATRVPLELTVDAVPGGLERELSTLEGVQTVTVEDTTISVELAETTDKARVIDHVGQQTQITDVISEEASLESMFERYAGGTPAEEAGEPNDEPAETVQPPEVRA